MTEWRPIPNFSFYDASENGEIRSWKRMGRKSVHGELRAAVPRLMSDHLDGSGYMMLTLVADDGKPTTVTTHSVVCEAWHGPRPTDQVVRHKDGNRLNNKPVNFEWGTPKQNKADQFKHGTLHQGVKCYQAKLTEDDVRAIRASNTLAKHEAEKYGVHTTTIYAIRNGKKWKHLIGKFPAK